MIGPASRAAALFAVIGVAGCAPATPPTVPQPPTGALESPEAPSAAPPSPTPGGRELALEVTTLGTEWTTPLLEFASDGEAIIFSSGVADGPDGMTAPDLWRYVPGTRRPELLWSNPSRERQIVRLGGEPGTWAFAEIGPEGKRAWDLYLLPGAGEAPVRLDTHPGDKDVPSFVPSFVVHRSRVVWTSFDRGPAGPVSQLLEARGPNWEPRLIAERDARKAELWLPSMRGSVLAYTEVVYSADRSNDERHLYMLDLADPSSRPRRLDSSGQATMPLLVDGGVIWKEADPGFNMFNWGRLHHLDLDTGIVSDLSLAPQDYVNYPSAGSRFVAAWGADAFTFTVLDLELWRSRTIARYSSITSESVLRPHVSGDLLVWLYSTQDGLGDGPPGEIRYAFLPPAGSSQDE